MLLISLPFQITRLVQRQVYQTVDPFCVLLYALVLRPFHYPITTATMSAGQSSRTGKAISFPDFMLDPNAVLEDHATWRLGAAPDYSNTRKVYERSKENK